MKREGAISGMLVDYNLRGTAPTGDADTFAGAI